MTKAKDWIDKRADGVVAKAFNLSYCIRIGMCKKIQVCNVVMRECARRVGLQQKCTNARSELIMVEITPPSRMDVLRPPSLTWDWGNSRGVGGARLTDVSYGRTGSQARG